MIWDTSIWRLGCSNPSKIRSAQKCYPCLRYELSPMSPGRTRFGWWAWVDLNHRPRPYQGLLWCYMHSSVAMIILLSTSFMVTSWHDCWFQIARSVQNGDHFLQAVSLLFLLETSEIRKINKTDIFSECAYPSRAPAVDRIAPRSHT